MSIKRMDWNNKGTVVAYAKHLGKGMTVFKHPNRRNYNITHTSRFVEHANEYTGCEIILQT